MSRLCARCGKPMFSSNHSVWIGKHNFEVHKQCEEEFIKEYNNLGKGKKNE